MFDAIQYIAIIRLVFFLLIILLACIYSIPIFFIKRFHTPINILTVNVCISCIVCSIYWIIYNILQIISFDDLAKWDCTLFQYIQTIVNCQEIYAICNVSLNRFCIIRYNNKVLFKTHRWVLTCIGIQWLIGVILPLPLFSIYGQSCGQMNEALWLRIYILLIIIIFPSAFFLIINIFIFLHARSSSRRVVPSNIPNQPSSFNSRDIRVAKRMILLLFLFLFGWSPVYILFTILNTNNIWVEILKLLAGFNLLGEIINLFLFNHKVWLYFKERFLRRMNFL